MLRPFGRFQKKPMRILDWRLLLGTFIEISSETFKDTFVKASMDVFANGWMEN